MLGISLSLILGPTSTFFVMKKKRHLHSKSGILIWDKLRFRKRKMDRVFGLDNRSHFAFT